MGTLSRRSFMKSTGAGAAAMVAGQSMVGKALAAPSNKVYTCYDESLVSGTTVSESACRDAYAALVKSMTGQSSEANAWKTIFAGASSSSKLCIKMNCLHVEDATPNHPMLNSLKALIGSLTTVFSAGNIYLIDNDLWKSNKSKVELAYGATALNSLGVKYPVEDYNSSKTISIGGKTFYPSNSLHAANFGMGFHMGRPHCCYADNLSGCIKNFMGAVSGSTTSYTAKGGGVQKFHGTYTDFADLFKNYIAAKIQLYISDNLFCCYDERETYSKVTKRLTLAEDPCAIDAWMVDYLNGVGGLRTAGKGVPAAVAAAGLGSTSYSTVNVSLSPQPPTAADVQDAIKKHKAGSVSEAAAQSTIDNYAREIGQ